MRAGRGRRTDQRQDTRDPCRRLERFETQERPSSGSLKALQESSLFSINKGNLISFTDSIETRDSGTSLVAKAKILDPQGLFMSKFLGTLSEEYVTALSEEVAETAAQRIADVDSEVVIAYGFDNENISVKRFRIYSIYIYSDSANNGIVEIDFLPVSRTSLGTSTGGSRTVAPDPSESVVEYFGTLPVGYQARGGFSARVGPRTLDSFRVEPASVVKTAIEDLLTKVLNKQTQTSYTVDGEPYKSMGCTVVIPDGVVETLIDNAGLPETTSTWTADNALNTLSEYQIFPYSTDDGNICLKYEDPAQPNLENRLVQIVQKMCNDANKPARRRYLVENDLLIVNKLKEEYLKGISDIEQAKMVAIITDIDTLSNKYKELNEDKVSTLNSFVYDDTPSEIKELVKSLPVFISNGPNSNVYSITQEKINHAITLIGGTNVFKYFEVAKTIGEIATGSDPEPDWDEIRQKSLQSIEEAFEGEDTEFTNLIDSLKRVYGGRFVSIKDNLKEKAKEVINGIIDHYQSFGGSAGAVDAAGFVAYKSLLTDLSNRYHLTKVKSEPNPTQTNLTTLLKPALVLSNNHFFSDLPRNYYPDTEKSYLSGVYRIRGITTHLTANGCFSEYSLYKDALYDNYFTGQ